MALICPPCSGDCVNGRYCPARVAPIRRAVAPLHTEEGGHTFNAGISFPMLSDEEAADEPLYTPSEASAWAVFGQIAAVAAAVSCAVLAVIGFLTAH